MRITPENQKFHNEFDRVLFYPKKIRDLLIEGKTEFAFQEFRSFSKGLNDQFQKNAIIILSKKARLDGQKLTLSYGKYEKRINKLTSQLLDFLLKIEEENMN